MAARIWVCDRPSVSYIDGFASPAEVESLLAQVGGVADLERRGIPWKHDDTGFSFELPTAESAALLELNRRIYRAVGSDSDFDPSLRYRRTRAGEFHPAHHDHFEIAGRVLIATAMLHLSDTAAGGETRFPEARPHAVSVAPKQGRLVIWLNHRADGSQDPLARHEGLPVSAGEKVTLTNFLYKPPESARLLVRR